MVSKKFILVHKSTKIRLFSKSLQMSTLRVFGVGRRTVGRGPGGGSRSYGAPTTTAGSLSAAADGPSEAIRSVDDVAAATKRRTTSRLIVCGVQLGISDRFPHSTNYFR